MSCDNSIIFSCDAVNAACVGFPWKNLVSLYSIVTWYLGKVSITSFLTLKFTSWRLQVKILAESDAVQLVATWIIVADFNGFAKFPGKVSWQSYCLIWRYRFSISIFNKERTCNECFWYFYVAGIFQDNSGCQLLEKSIVTNCNVSCLIWILNYYLIKRKYEIIVNTQFLKKKFRGKFYLNFLKVFV